MAVCLKCGTELFGGTKCYRCNLSVGNPKAQHSSTQRPGAPPRPRAPAAVNPSAAATSPPASLGPMPPVATPATRRRSTFVLIGVGCAVLFGILLLVLSTRGDDGTPRRDVQQPPTEDSSAEIPQYDYTDYPSWDDYPAEFRSEFLSACYGEAPTERCVCALEELEQRLTMSDLESLGYIFPDQILTQVLLACT